MAFFLWFFKFSWVFLIHETTIPANWKPIFRISETDLILLRWYKLVLASFVKPLPHKRCEAGFTYGDNTSRIPEAKLCRANCGFLWPDSRWNTSRIIHSAKKNLYSVQNLRFPVISDILGLDEGRSSYGQNKNIY